INDSIKYAFLEVISKRDNESVNQSNRRIRPSNQTGLEDFIEKNPYFIEFIKQLRTAYKSPSRKMLSDHLINEELGRITVKMNKLLENS
ncbi:1550_t:CDS:2, partial [Entrophospora sp. SA101]